MSKARARKIKLVLFDVDGVLTDGTIWLFPAPAGVEQSVQAIVSYSMLEAKGFHAHDGTAMALARLGGLKTGIITKRMSETVALRARDLRFDHVHQGAADKISVFEEILKKEGLAPAQACYVGDDIIDLGVMRRCGLAVAVANARQEVKHEAHLVTRHGGGEGAARDVVEYILRAQGTWDRVLSQYIAGRRVRKEATSGKQ